MDFLTGTAIQQAVQAIMSRPGDVMAAVSYWGKHGEKRTGLKSKENPHRARIICDLDDVACNPFAIAGLRIRQIRVKTLPGLHAKVWISGDDVIVGSANASGAALPRKPNDSKANVEAAFEIHDRERAQVVREWFNARWDDADEISNTHLERAKRRWQDAQAGKRQTSRAPRSKAGERADVGWQKLKKWLIKRAAKVALELNREGDFDRDFILTVLRHCKQNGEWRDGYARYIGGDVDDQDNAWKRNINPMLGKRIRKAVGAERILTAGGHPRRKSVRGPDIVGQYTLLEIPSDENSAPS